MRLLSSFLLLFCMINATSVSGQSSPGNEAIVKVFEKVLKAKRDQWAKSNYNSVIFVPDAEIKQTVIFHQFKATSFDSVGFYRPSQDKSGKFLYFFPVPLDTTYTDGEMQMHFPNGGYSFIEERSLSKNLTFRGDTIIYKTDSAKSVKYPGTYGLRIMPDKDSKINARLSYAWYLPEGYEYISYKSNRKGYWQREDNLIHFVGDFEENNFLFEIRFRKKHEQPAILLGRTINYTKTIPVTADHIDLFINDAQTEDGDIISLNLNGEWIVRGLEVTKAGAKIRVPLIHKKNYLIMHAENLGSIPPNTASMKLNDGTKVHEITLNSDAGKSEGILFVRP
ncbi:hypothetical protein [Chitinophaga sp. S165]|uniref:hypothetical protein n=1 Tax=Chitinophaga sp. S165 TaxID=2135462 RepID=UPI000D71CF48|nr:hypothetical protein [Chitinophaga sp. S165]PWV56312.1 hypothetical protein C7475_101827 [Chitinophaga sp. S165]